MASVPAHVGKGVLFHSHLEAPDAERHAALVISVPKFIWEGHPNIDDSGNPICVDLKVFSAAGDHVYYRIRHESVAAASGESFWSEQAQ